MGIDFQGLKAVYDAAKAEPNFNMANWLRKTPCGTTHCMIGAFCIANPQDALKLRWGRDGGSAWPYIHSDIEEATWSDAVSIRFGITGVEAKFLFTADHNYRAKVVDACDLTKSQALARLRKFIYYKLHKQEMIVENNDRNRSIELPRNVSGRRSVVMAQSA